MSKSQKLELKLKEMYAKDLKREKITSKALGYSTDA